MHHTSLLAVETAVPLRRTLYELVLGSYSLPVLRPCTDHVSFSSLPATPVRFSDVGYAYHVKSGNGRETEEDGRGWTYRVEDIGELEETCQWPVHHNSVFAVETAFALRHPLNELVLGPYS